MTKPKLSDLYTLSQSKPAETSHSGSNLYSSYMTVPPLWQYRGGGVNAGSGTLLKECCFRVRVRVRLGGCQWNAGSGSWVEPEPGSGSICFCKECCFRVGVMGDVQMSNRLKLKIARCGIQNPGRFCLWNRKSWTLQLLFRFFIYLFIFLDFWDQEKHFLLTSRFDNAFQVFPVCTTCTGSTIQSPHQLFSCLFYWPTWQIKYVSPQSNGSSWRLQPTRDMQRSPK